MKKPLPAEFTVYMRRYTVGTILICICDTFLDRECFGEYSNIYSNRREYDVVNSAHIFRLHVHQFRQFRRSYLQIYVHSFFTIPQSTFNKKNNANLWFFITKPVFLHFTFVHKVEARRACIRIQLIEFDINSVRERKRNISVQNVKIACKTCYKVDLFRIYATKKKTAGKVEFDFEPFEWGKKVKSSWIIYLFIHESDGSTVNTTKV